jgi:hypothetical protein
MSRKGGVEGEIQSIPMANFSYHQYIHILSQEEPQNVFDGFRGRPVDLSYVGQTVFDGIFDGENPFVECRQMEEQGVQGGGLAASDGARKAHASVGAVKIFQDTGLVMKVQLGKGRNV